VKPGTPLAKALSVLVALYLLGTFVWAWGFHFRAELHKPLLVVYLSVFTAAFAVAGALLLRWAWRSRGGGA
jgi:hypothetical protein